MSSFFFFAGLTTCPLQWVLLSLPWPTGYVLSVGIPSLTIVANISSAIHLCARSIHYVEGTTQKPIFFCKVRFLSLSSWFQRLCIYERSKFILNSCSLRLQNFMFQLPIRISLVFHSCFLRFDALVSANISVLFFRISSLVVGELYFFRGWVGIPFLQPPTWSTRSCNSEMCLF